MEQYNNIRSAVVAFMKEKWLEQGKRIVGQEFEHYQTKSEMDKPGQQKQKYLQLLTFWRQPLWYSPKVRMDINGSHTIQAYQEELTPSKNFF